MDRNRSDVSANDYVFRASAFQAKFKCTNAVTGPANSCVGPSPIPDASWHTFVAECLAESPVIAETGECIDWARSQDVWYGTMPNWDTSLVEDMSGYDGMALVLKALVLKVHSTATFRSGTQGK